MRHFGIFVILSVFVAASLAGSDKKELWMKKRLAEKLRLHKEENNFIDHGPKHHKRNHHKYGHVSTTNNGLLGHRGEHWALKTTGKKHRQQNDRDDIRLQDVGYEPPVGQQEKLEVLEQEYHHQRPQIVKRFKNKHGEKKRKGHKKNLRKLKKKMSKDEVATLKKQAKKAALKGMGVQAAVQGLESGSHQDKLARRFYNKWAAKYNKNKKNRENVP